MGETWEKFETPKWRDDTEERLKMDSSGSGRGLETGVYEHTDSMKS